MSDKEGAGVSSGAGLTLNSDNCQSVSFFGSVTNNFFTKYGVAHLVFPFRFARLCSAIGRAPDS